MGGDKALMPLGGQPLVQWVADSFGPQVQDLALSANGDAQRFAFLGLPVLADLHSQGPLSGVLAGLHWAALQGASALVTVPCDGPFVPPDLVPRLCLAAEGGHPALAQSGQDLLPTYGLWPTACLPALQTFLTSGAVARLRDFAQTQGSTWATFPMGSFANANTPKDLADLADRLAKRA
jgi:molybdopterin-guanine dinucleotide biosynthesis protein A